MSINLQKKINLVKTVLEEKQISNIQGRIVLALDISASMKSLFNNGTVQDLVERLLAIGVNMDSNKEIEVYLFGTKSHEASAATLSNIDGYTRKEITNKYALENSTKYAGVIKRIAGEFLSEPIAKKGFISRIFGNKENTVASAPTPTEEPTIVFFITDGENFDQSQTTALIQQLSRHAIFWQFVGIGSHQFDYLSHLDEMSGRYIDNANFFPANDIKKISDEELYSRILGELPSWINEARSKGVLV